MLPKLSIRTSITSFVRPALQGLRTQLEKGNFSLLFAIAFPASSFADATGMPRIGYVIALIPLFAIIVAAGFFAVQAFGKNKLGALGYLAMGLLLAAIYAVMVYGLLLPSFTGEKSDLMTSLSNGLTLGFTGLISWAFTAPTPASGK